jgi:hypothetical protein
MKGAIRTPLSWFSASVRAIRDMIGFPATAYVVSDGTPEDLHELLGLPNMILVRPGCAISDLLTLARCRVLIGSGGSSFSAWASFLGQMPTISHPGQSLGWFKLGASGDPYVGEFEPSSPPENFAKQVAATFMAPVT